MKRNKLLLLSSLLFLSYVIYVLVKSIFYYSQPEKYGDIYFEFMFIPHIVLIIFGTLFNFIAYFINNKYIKYITVVFYVFGIIFLFINK